MAGPGETLGVHGHPLPYTHASWALEWAQQPIDRQNEVTKKPRFKKFEETKDFLLYSKRFVIVGAFYYEINYRALKLSFLL
jgi:hypothetical protein